MLGMPLEPRRANVRVLAIPAFAALLALALWVSTPRRGTLVPYALEVIEPPLAGAELLSPGGRLAAPLELGAARALVVELRPRTATSESVEADALLARTDAVSGSLTPWEITQQVLPSGGLRLTLSTRGLPSRGRLLVRVGRSRLLPAIPAGEAAHGRDWQRFDLDFVKRPTKQGE
jgi:hypothetical protein